MFRKCLEAFVWPSKQFWKIFGKWSEIFGNSSKTSSLVCLYNKQNITRPLVDTNVIFSCSIQYLTRLLPSLVRYRVKHSKIKFVSARGHVICSIYYSIHNLYQIKFTIEDLKARDFIIEQTKMALTLRQKNF